MSPDLDAILCTRYPGIFGERHNPTSPMANGITCGDGWFTLIDCLFHRIELDAKEKHRKPPVARQVKEKLGGLRIYWRNATESDQALTQLAEHDRAWPRELGRARVCTRSRRRSDRGHHSGIAAATGEADGGAAPVSYTHLTLPTSDLV